MNCLFRTVAQQLVVLVIYSPRCWRTQMSDLEFLCRWMQHYLHMLDSGGLAWRSTSPLCCQKMLCCQPLHRERSVLHAVMVMTTQQPYASFLTSLAQSDMFYTRTCSFCTHQMYRTDILCMHEDADGCIERACAIFSSDLSSFT